MELLSLIEREILRKYYKYYNSINVKNLLPTSSGAAYLQVPGQTDGRRERGKTAPAKDIKRTAQEDKRMENNVTELNPDRLENASGSVEREKAPNNKGNIISWIIRLFSGD